MIDWLEVGKVFTTCHNERRSPLPAVLGMTCESLRLGYAHLFLLDSSHQLGTTYVSPDTSPELPESLRHELLEREAPPLGCEVLGPIPLNSAQDVASRQYLWIIRVFIASGAGVVLAAETAYPDGRVLDELRQIAIWINCWVNTVGTVPAGLDWADPWKEIIERSPIPSLVCGPDGHVLDCNENYCRTFGFRDREWVLRYYNPFEDMQLIESGVVALLREAVRGAPVQLNMVVYQIAREWGTERVRLIPHIISLRDAKGEVIRLVLTWEDMTELIENQERLQRQAAELSTLFSMSNAIAEQGNLHLAMAEVLSLSRSYLHLDAGWLYTLNRHTGKTRLISYEGIAEEYITEFLKILSEQPGIFNPDELEKIVLLGQSEEHQPVLDLDQKYGLHAHLVVLVTVRSDLLSLLHFAHHQPWEPQSADMRFLRLVAGQANIAVQNAYTAEMKQEFAHKLQNFSEISKNLISHLEFNLLMEQILWIIQETFTSLNCSISMLDEERTHLRVVAKWGQTGEGDLEAIPIGQGLTGWAAEFGQTVNCGDVLLDSRYIPGTPSTRSELAVPMFLEDRVIGVLNVESRYPHRFTEEDVWLLSTLAAQSALAVERAQLYTTIRRQATTDVLTGLANRQYFEEQLTNRSRNPLAQGEILVVMLFDLDGLKVINDSLGHALGDQALRESARILRETKPSNGFLARHGGDEFILMFTTVDPEHGPDELIQTIGEAVEDSNKTGLNPFRIAFSTGYALQNHVGDLESLVRAADRAMYRSKAKSRRRV